MQPVNSNGFVAGPPVPFRDGLVLQFDFDAPSSKVTPTGEYAVIGMTPAGPLYLPLFEPDPDFPAFQRCPKMAP